MNKEAYKLMAHAEDLQKMAEQATNFLSTTVKQLEGNVVNAVLSSTRSEIDKNLGNIKKELLGATMGLVETSEKAKSTAEFLMRTSFFVAVLILATAMAVGGAFFGVGNLLIKSRVNELEELKYAIQVEEASLRELQSETWKLELVRYEDGRRAIILPSGININHTGSVDGRIAIVLRP
ncbi:MAG: hypothetical protein ACRCSC_05160 [Lactococcus garvieae]